MRYLFESCEFDSERRELRRGETVVHLEPQVFDLLELLLRNRERVVGKDEIFSAIWQQRGVSDAVLTTRLNAARRAIGDDGATQHLIRTFRRKGLRFVASVREESTGRPDWPVATDPTELTPARLIATRSPTTL